MCEEISHQRSIISSIQSVIPSSSAAVHTHTMMRQRKLLSTGIHICILSRPYSLTHKHTQTHCDSKLPDCNFNRQTSSTSSRCNSKERLTHYINWSRVAFVAALQFDVSGPSVNIGSQKALTTAALSQNILHRSLFRQCSNRFRRRRVRQGQCV